MTERVLRYLALTSCATETRLPLPSRVSSPLRKRTPCGRSRVFIFINKYN